MRLAVSVVLLGACACVLSQGPTGPTPITDPVISPAPPASCRRYRESCTQDADCCGELFCKNCTRSMTCRFRRGRWRERGRDEGWWGNGWRGDRWRWRDGGRWGSGRGRYWGRDRGRWDGNSDRWRNRDYQGRWRPQDGGSWDQSNRGRNNASAAIQKSKDTTTESSIRENSVTDSRNSTDITEGNTEAFNGTYKPDDWW